MSSELKSGTAIERVEVTRVFVPYKKMVHWSAGVRPGTTRLIVQVHTADGTIGLGETICLHEFIEPVLTKTIVPLCIGEDAHDIERIVRKIDGAGYYHHKRAMVAALCGLEMALWDIVGKKANLPLYKIWGGKYRESVALVAYLQSSDIDEIAAEAAEFCSRGYGTVKIKLGSGMELDIELVKAVRDAVGPRVKIRGDVNGAWTIGTAKRQLRKLEKYDLEYVEQPLPLEDLEGHAALRRLSSVPIALDESAFTLQDVMSIIKHDAADMILIDPHEAGGLQQARKEAIVAEAAGLPVTLHSGAELGISTAAYLHLATSTQNLSLAIDTQYHNQSADIVTQPFNCIKGVLNVPGGCGLGVELDPNQLAKFKTDTISNPYLDPARSRWFPEKPQY